MTAAPSDTASNSLGRALARFKAVCSLAFHSRSDIARAQRAAGTAFAIRVGGAGIVYLSQVALARWMGSSEFGWFVYVWTWVLLSGDLIHLGLASAAPRLVPEYRERQQYSSLKGFLIGSQWLVLAMASVLAIAAAAIASTMDLSPSVFQLALLACVSLPFYALANMLDGIARSSNWMNLALLPPYFIRPLLLVGLITLVHALGLTTSAPVAMACAAGASVIAVAYQWFEVNRRLAIEIPATDPIFDAHAWFATSLPIFLVWSFYTLLTYTDVILLKQFRPAQDVAVYFAATKTLALVAFIYFAVSAAVAHKFAEYHVSGRNDELATLLARSITWTFWPSLAATALIIGAGKLMLGLFGPDFAAGYSMMFIVALGLLARASVGPAERLLNMLGQQRACAGIYAIAFAAACVGCLLLIPRLGATGAAIAMACALTIESALLFVVVKMCTGLHAFIWNPTRPPRPSLAPGAQR